MDFNFMIEHIPEYIEAGVLTMGYGFIGILLSIIVGIIVAIIMYKEVPVLKQISSIYIELSRNTPLLVQLFLLYFGLPKLGIVLSSSACAVVGLTFLGGSYMAESIRAGLQSVGKSQIESALSIGLKEKQILRYIVLPQAFTVSFSGILANVIFLIKETSVFSVVAIADLMYVAKDLIGIYYKTDEALLMLVISYLIILLPISIIGGFIERRISYGAFGS
ncbi:amino acid ABC transporter permease [Peptoniphilus sp. MSJ-1]|uniref:Amino acid ABC transporter permease n=1 Tax=Peptoniphilus ovalis TaxID=2841503 RepID=A0ABS6FDM8_9FIRM|nr:amino acid ABC transporter permease [Peptoniphilus ovalis]MBU5668288.1 amino acid ABC transporter permease [Peptoniphilus ovalis]